MTGLDFTPPQTVPLKHFQDSRGRRALELTVCYSIEGPPFLELVQADPEGGVFGVQNLGGVHHVGFHDPDVLARMNRLNQEDGLELEAARFGNKDESRMGGAFTAPTGLYGVRLEIVDERGRAALLDWIRPFADPT